jgi:hypothetical protein
LRGRRVPAPLEVAFRMLEGIGRPPLEVWHPRHGGHPWKALRDKNKTGIGDEHHPPNWDFTRRGRSRWWRRVMCQKNMMEIGGVGECKTIREEEGT